MLRTLTIQDILDTLDIVDYSGYKLCYIDSIPETCTDWSLESRKIISSPDFSWEESHKKYGHNNPHLWMEEFENPDFIPGVQEHYVWFTNNPDQWGDDWDDAPYEHNAGYPYEEDGYDLIKVPVCFAYYCKFPCDYGGGNSPFSVDDINSGAVPWAFAKRKRGEVIRFEAGISPELFIQKIHALSTWNQ